MVFIRSTTVLTILCPLVPWKVEKIVQVALNNSGLQIQLNQEVLKSIQYLNSQAAQNVQKNVEGKITVALNEGVGNTQRFESAPKFNSIVSLATGKDKNGSAPSYKGEFLFIKKEEKDNKDIEIFA